MSQSKEDPLASKNPKSSTPVQKPFPSFLGQQQMVTVKVKGLEGTRIFLLHKNFACYYSQMLDKAFNGQFIEGQTQSTEIEFDYPDSFGIIQNWMYRQKLESGDGTALPADQIYNVWVLADYLLMPKLQNYATTQILSRPSGFIQGSCSKWIYKNTGPDSKLRHLFVNTLAWDLSAKDLMDHWNKDNLPAELLIDVLNVLKNDIRICHQCRRGLDCGKQNCPLKGGQPRVNDKLIKEKYTVEENNA